jgi:hypothetical protein
MQIVDKERSVPGATPRRVMVGLALAALASLALMVAGCGGSFDDGVAQVGTTTETTSTESGSADGSRKDDPAAYSACMRKNGVPKFPDPDSEGRLRLKAGPDTGIDPESAQFKAAAKACRKFAPPAPSPAQQTENRDQLLAFSACVRENGVPNFPDPKFNPDGSGGIMLERGIDRTPQFKAAVKACKKLLPDGPGSRDSEGGTP